MSDKIDKKSKTEGEAWSRFDKSLDKMFGKKKGDGSNRTDKPEKKEGQQKVD